GAWLHLAVVAAAWGALRAGDLWWPATFFMFSPRWPVALPAVLLVPTAAVFRRRALAPAALAVLLTLGPVMGFCVPWPDLGSDAPSGASLRVLTCNLHYTSPAADRLVRLVDDTRPDV